MHGTREGDAHASTKLDSVSTEGRYGDTFCCLEQPLFYLRDVRQGLALWLRVQAPDQDRSEPPSCARALEGVDWVHDWGEVRGEISRLGWDLFRLRSDRFGLEVKRVVMVRGSKAGGVRSSDVEAV